VAVPVLRLVRGRIGTYNMHLRGIADARGCYLVDLWSMRFLRSAGAWSQDRLHLTAQSHQRVALRACEVVGVPVTEDWRAPLAGETPTGPLTGGGDAASRAAWLAARREDARWAREYLAPWINRRLRGTSSGDGLTAKRPVLAPVAPPVTT
jgi:hypothetical protein